MQCFFFYEKKSLFGLLAGDGCNFNSLRSPVSQLVGHKEGEFRRASHRCRHLTLKKEIGRDTRGMR